MSWNGTTICDVCGDDSEADKERDSLKTRVEQFGEQQYLPLDCPLCGRRRLEYTPATGELACEKCGSDADTLNAEIESRKKVIDEMNELQRKAIPPIAELVEENMQLETRVAQLTGALQFYASRETWLRHHQFEQIEGKPKGEVARCTWIPATEDAGKKAREALSGEHPQPHKPRVVCLCGSTKFKKEYEEENRKLTLAGNIVLTCGLFLGSGDTCTPEEEAAIKELHFRKIDLADEIRVVNVGGYIGESTSKEIEYAKAQGKPVSYLETVVELKRKSR